MQGIRALRLEFLEQSSYSQLKRILKGRKFSFNEKVTDGVRPALQNQDNFI